MQHLHTETDRNGNNGNNGMEEKMRNDIHPEGPFIFMIAAMTFLAIS
jgi:hypothetical protein